jgi:thiol:disulfide interchange protein
MNLLIAVIASMIFLSSCENTFQREGVNSKQPSTKTPKQNELDLSIEKSKETGKPVYLYFTGKSCSYCREFEGKVLSKPAVKEKLKEVIFLKVDAHKNTSLTQKFNIQGIPTGILLKIANGQPKIVNRHEGYINQDAFMKFINEAK